LSLELSNCVLLFTPVAVYYGLVCNAVGLLSEV